MAEESTFLPNKCGIPSFCDLEAHQIAWFAAKAFVGAGSPQLAGGADRQQFLNLVRLTDRTIVNFVLSREELQGYIAHRHEGDFGSLFASVSHVEAGVTALARCLIFAEALMKSDTAPPVERSELPPKPLRERIRKLRNKIEHYDEDIAHGTIPTETMPMLHVLDDRVQLTSISITWPEIDVAVRLIHSLTARLIAL
ncbi:hypothetical protein [Rhodococcus sp. NPDC057529]|uniref:hypothetical protein n=1 Tax=Rhodococcus sp. NPDC057529 TaxID=3346158 RepID=UPI003672E3B3